MSVTVSRCGAPDTAAGSCWCLPGTLPTWANCPLRKFLHKYGRGSEWVVVAKPRGYLPTAHLCLVRHYLGQ